MKDLYKRIGLDDLTSDTEVIRIALRLKEKDDAHASRAAAHVLLDEKRKAVYDRVFVVVSRIGKVRSDLGLARTTAWLKTNSTDFDRPPTGRPSTGDRITKSSGTKNWEVWSAVGVPLLLLGFVVWGFGRILHPGVDANADSAAARPPSELDPTSGITSTLEVVGPEVAPPSWPRQQAVMPLQNGLSKSEDVQLTRATARVRARLRSMGLARSEAEVNAYAVRLTSGPREPTPQTGVYYRSSTVENFAPLEVKTRPGSNYFVKIVSVEGERVILTAFIRGGEPFETTLPVGTYKIRYAAGDSWYGPLLDFGLAAAYSSCDDLFNFRRSVEGYSGYTIELILQQNGNLGTSPIDPEDF